MLSRTPIRWGFGSTFSCTFTKLVTSAVFFRLVHQLVDENIMKVRRVALVLTLQTKFKFRPLIPFHHPNLQTLHEPSEARHGCLPHSTLVPHLVFCCWRLCGAVQSGFPLTNNRRRELVTWSIRWLVAPQIHLCSSHSLTTALHVHLWVLTNKAH